MEGLFSFGDVVALGGSRVLPQGGAGLVGRVALGLVSSGRRLVVGCCSGADAAALSAVPSPAVDVLAAFGPGGIGAGPWSAVGLVLRHAERGGAVSWWAGGGPSVPLFARLAARSRAVIAQASGLVVFLASPASRGSLLAARSAVVRGLPVVAVPLGFPASDLPPLGSGRWVSVGGGLLSGASLWLPSPGLFDEWRS